jgi:xylulokinase
MSYPEINQLAGKSPIGADGLQCFPFGNGAERVLDNRDPGSTIRGLQFNRHNRSHLARAAQEGIVFSLYYGIEIMMEMGLSMSTVRAGKANMFLSEVFTEAFVNTTGACVELYNTDGAQGAARAAGAGARVFADRNESFKGLQRIARFEPEARLQTQYQEAYFHWRTQLSKDHPI